MRRFGKWLGRILLVLLVLAAAAALWKREEIKRLLAVNSLFSEEKIVANFSDMQGAFLSTQVDRGTGPISTLASGPEHSLPPSVETWIQDRHVTALVVLHKGQIAYENYFRGTTAQDRRISWSMAKSYLSALVGILLDEGVIASIDDPVTKYAPSLKGSAYDGASLRNVLHMSSGVVFDEDYLDPKSDINRMGRVLALGGKMDDFTTELTQTFSPPGETWKYVSIDTHVVGMVVRGATGRSIPDLLSEKIIQPLGLEEAPYYLTDGVGTAFVLGGLNLRTRDYARFGQMFLQGGTWQGQSIVPTDWVAASTAASAPTEDGKIGYGYQWWIPKGAVPGEYMARGIYGQYTYINTAAQVVIVSNAADRKFRETGVSDQDVETFRTITQSLR